MIDEAVDEMQQRKLTATKDCMFSLACIDNNKPTGLSKSFQMLQICLTLNEMTDEIPTKEELWDKLRSLVDLKQLAEKEEEEREEGDQTFCENFEKTEDFKIPDDIIQFANDEAENPKDEDEPTDKPAKPVIKDYTRNRTPKAKPKEEEEAEEDSDGKLESPDSDEDDTPLKPPKVSRRSQARRSAPARKSAPKRGSRNVKDSVEHEASPASTSSKKNDEEGTTRKVNLGKRSLRSRGDEDGYGSSPTHTPPPTTRSRRI